MTAPDEDRYAEHMRVINSITSAWNAGGMSLQAKRERIAAENLRYYGAHARSPVTAESLTAAPRSHDEIIYVLATSMGVPVDVMRQAQDARRRGDEQGYHRILAGWRDSQAGRGDTEGLIARSREAIQHARAGQVRASHNTEIAAEAVTGARLTRQASGELSRRACRVCGTEHDPCKFARGSLYCVKAPCANPHHRPSPYKITTPPPDWPGKS